MAKPCVGGEDEAEKSQTVQDPGELLPFGQAGLYILGDWQRAFRMVQAAGNIQAEIDDAEKVDDHQRHARVAASLVSVLCYVLRGAGISELAYLTASSSGTGAIAVTSTCFNLCIIGCMAYGMEVIWWTVMYCCCWW